MRQILILVEGQTEEAFVKEVVNPYLYTHGLYLSPTIINTKIIKGGKNFKGGFDNYGQIKRDLIKLVKQNSLPVTTFFDYYGLPDDFPGIDAKTRPGTARQRVEQIEQSLYDDIGYRHLIPYIQLHEFETLLFTAIDGFRYCCSREQEIAAFQQIIEQYPNPEEINDSPLTAPSKRILSILPAYNKPFQGCMIALENRIDNTLSRCPHFAQWIQRLLNDG